MLSTKECLSVVQDRDYLTMLFLIIFCLSLLGISIHIFTYRDAGLFFMTFLLSRLLFIYRTDLKCDSVLKPLIQMMDEARARPGFEKGDPSSLIDASFPGINQSVRSKCLRKLLDSGEVELIREGDYAFYARKAFKRP